MNLSWGNKVDDDFNAAVIKLSKDLGWTELHASWLMACIAFETGETFDPSIRNAAGSGAVGLIQFMPRTAQGLGTTSEKLAAMTAVDQLVYVKKYMKPYADKIESLSDMYMAIFAPKAVGKPPDFILYSSGAPYRMNAPLDTNKDGKITKIEATRFVSAKLRKGMDSNNYKEVPWEDKVSTSVMESIAKIEEDFLALKKLIVG